MESIKQYRHPITVALALVGIGLMLYYDYCDTACSYLRGDILGADLKWIGIAYMAAIIAFAFFRQSDFVRSLLAAGIGVEVFLLYFQLRQNVFCPFCLAFAATVIITFIVNYEASKAWQENQLKMWAYFLGEVNFPMFKIKRLPLVVIALIGYFFVFLTFTGSATPAYGQDKAPCIPSLGSGSYEIVIFTDYFCPPCKRIDTKAEPLFKELLTSEKVKLIFIDVPFARSTPIYAKYYLYAFNANSSVNNILHARKILFDAAQTKRIQKEDDLVAYLKEQQIAVKIMDEKSVFPLLSVVIKKYKVNQTPTCVIKYSDTSVKKYIGEDEIWNGLTELKAYLKK